MDISISIFAVNCIIYIHFCLYPCLLFLSMTLFVCHFIPPNEISKGILCLYFCPGSFHHLSAYFLFRPFTFTQKSDCDITCTSRINFVLSVTSIITVLVKLLQMLWGYVTRLGSVSFFVSLSISLMFQNISYNSGILSPRAGFNNSWFIFHYSSWSFHEPYFSKKHFTNLIGWTE